jgi:hypothetical protein
MKTAQALVGNSPGLLKSRRRERARGDGRADRAGRLSQVCESQFLNAAALGEVGAAFVDF